MVRMKEDKEGENLLMAPIEKVKLDVIVEYCGEVRTSFAAVPSAPAAAVFGHARD